MTHTAKKPTLLTAIGLMSGTSLDGIDVALIKTDGQDVVEFGPAQTYAYQGELREKLRALLGKPECPPSLEQEFSDHTASVVRQFVEDFDLAAQDIDVVGFHGQTIFHQPDQGFTKQIGDGARLGERLGIDVVNDFRSNDVAHGGQGAPLVPVFHRALAAEMAKPLAILNLGGVGNVTLIDQDAALYAFDTGPANALIDDWVRSNGAGDFDQDGKLAKAGTIDQAALQKMLSHPYFEKLPPKSLDRDEFAALARGACAGLGLADGAATLTAFTCHSVAKACAFLADKPSTWIVCGGGAHNQTILRGLKDCLGGSVVRADDLGWMGDAIEAQAFAYMAVRTLKGLPITFPGTTGIETPLCGGRFHPRPSQGGIKASA